LIRDAGIKAASIRSLRRTSVPVISAGNRRAAIEPGEIVTGILAVHSIWGESFEHRVAGALSDLSPLEHLDLGCALQQGAFECKPGGSPRFSTSDEARIFFVIRLIVRLRALGTAPAADLMQYGRALKSLRSFRDAA